MAYVGYRLDDGTVVRFEVEPNQQFGPAGTDEVVGRLKEAVAPMISGAKVLFDGVRELSPDEIKVKFGVKVTGTATWVVAKAATEGNIELTLTWKGAQ